MGDDLIDIAMSYIEDDEPVRTTWQSANLSAGPFIAVEEPYEPIEFVTPLQNIGRLADTISNSIYSLGNNLAGISYQPSTEEERQAYRQFVKSERKRQEKEKNYEQFQEFTRILERTYYN